LEDSTVFKIEFETGNAAFEDSPGYEAARILRQIADKLEGSIQSGKVMDANGNTIGKWELETD
jgi:hypothetical protein